MQSALKAPADPAPLPPELPSLGTLESELQRVSAKVDTCLSEILSLKAVRPAVGADARLAMQRAAHASGPSAGSRFSAWPGQDLPARPTAFQSEASSATSGLYGSSTSEADPRHSVRPRLTEAGGLTASEETTLRRRIAMQARDVDLEVAWKLQAKKMCEDDVTDMQPMLRLVERSWTESLWEFLDDPTSSCFAWWTWLFLKLLVVLSFVISCSQTPESPSRMDPVAAAIWETSLDTFFLFEFLARVISTPSKKTYFKDRLNWADMVSALGLPLRASVGFVIYVDATSRYQQTVNTILLLFIPLVRFLKLLRYFEAFRLLVDAFKNSVEALPVLAYLMALITALGATAIYLSEDRSNIPSFQHAMWFAIITMTSVGYGDYYPESFEGYVSVSVLTFVSVLFLALPVGIIGYEFTCCWRNRWKVLLIQKARKCLEKWGYSAKDVRVLFDYVDVDGDGSLNLSEFIELIRQMRVGISAETSFHIFSLFDDDQNGSLDCTEFLRHVFPEEYVKEAQEKQTPVRKSRHVVSLALHHLETEGQGHGGVTRETVTRETRFAEG